MPDVYFDESMVTRFGAASGAGGAQRVPIGSRLFVGAVVVPDGAALELELDEKASIIFADPIMWSFRGGVDGAKTGTGTTNRRASFGSNHFHFADDSDRIRSAALEVMLAHDFRVHVFYSHLTVPDLGRVDVQKAMYFTLVRILLQRYSGTQLTLTFEKEQQMNSSYGAIVKHALDSLDCTAPRKERHARANAVFARSVAKPNGGVATIDYCLGIVNHGLQGAYNDAENPIQAYRLETLAALDPHIAHLADFDTARHRRRFDMLKSPGWARYITGVNSHSIDSYPIVTSIRSDPTGLFEFVKDAASLASALGKTAAALAAACQRAQEPDSYRQYRIKIRGKWRELAQPTDPALDGVLRRLVDFLHPFNSILHPSCVAYVPGRGCFDAAAPHAGHEWIQKLDIKSFFPSTSRELVIQTFMRLGATLPVAEILGTLTTFRNELTTGARTSPQISNLILGEFDKALADEADRQHLTYTRYADDLVFSGGEKFDMSADVTRHLVPLGYSLNLEKTALRRRGQPVKIAGLTVFESDAPRLPKRLKRRLRLELFLLNKAIDRKEVETRFDDDSTSEGFSAERAAKTQGLFRFARSIQPQWSQSLLDQFPAAKALIQPAASAPRKSQSVELLVQRIGKTNVPTLTDEMSQIGLPAVLDPD